MDTGRFTVVEARDFLLRFGHWSAHLAGSYAVRIDPLRTGVRNSTDLTREERSELYEVAIPTVERLIEQAFDRGQLDITQHWMDNRLFLRCELDIEVDSTELRAAYHRVLNIAA
ncbi:hypothetical protein M0Q28_04570 [Patescibacteria group bacterium]|jgi:hypothetical protein|nr:hypothetical protein [Patescibacteria group bacterium]